MHWARACVNVRGLVPQRCIVKVVTTISLCILISIIVGGNEYNHSIALSRFVVSNATLASASLLLRRNPSAHESYAYKPNHHSVCKPSRFDPSKYSEIYLLHMRKAGGTTLRTYLTRVAAKYNLTFRATEGEPDQLISPNDSTGKGTF